MRALSGSVRAEESGWVERTAWTAWVARTDFEERIAWAEGSDIARLVEWAGISDMADWIAQVDSFGMADWAPLCFALSPFHSTPFVCSRPHSSLAPSALASHPSPLHSLADSPPPQLQTVPSLSLRSDSPLCSHCCSSQRKPRRSMHRLSKRGSADSASKTARLGPYPRCAKRIWVWTARLEVGCMWA